MGIPDKVVWTVFCDGSCASFGVGVVIVIILPSKLKTLYAAKLEFQCINNIAEYKAILLGLRMLKAMCVKTTILKSDS